ncbi:NAD(P)H-dependent oxidoreductase [Paenibacillus assamensis]|uniref:NAD(P)H-dependent oxidoreductase n=1 Tax=Paenibacillus assamensis TaxID=311244 RepID=UPI00041C7D74|nr:NAD(P)H-dependent oxidoreductase [Paenibacillus assamensis]
MTNVLVISAHPNSDSFNHGVLDEAVSELQSLGHEIQIRDLYSLQFDPVMTVEDLANSKEGTARGDVLAEQELVQWADMLIVIYPLWWAGLPALLKGYIDRVFAYGFAYAMNDSGLQKLLTGKKALLITTMGNSEAHYRQVGMFEALQKTIDEGIFDFVGIQVLEHRYFESVPTVDDTTRANMLEHVKELIRTHLFKS